MHFNLIVFKYKRQNYCHSPSFFFFFLSFVSVKPAKQQRWPSMFDQRGVIIVPVRNDMDVTNIDKYIEIAIEAGAEDVIVTDNDAQVPDVKSILKVIKTRLLASSPVFTGRSDEFLYSTKYLTWKRYFTLNPFPNIKF